MRYLVDELYPTATVIDLVLDNLNTHTYAALVETFGKGEADPDPSSAWFFTTRRDTAVG